MLPIRPYRRLLPRLKSNLQKHVTLDFHFHNLGQARQYHALPLAFDGPDAGRLAAGTEGRSTSPVTSVGI